MGKTVKVDLTGVESFQRCAEGLHTVKIATAEVKQSQGGNDMIVIAFEVTKGVDKGARVYENFPLVDKALWKLKGLLQAIGMKADGKVSVDLDKLIGKVCNINVQHEEYDGKIRARVESIMKFAATSDESDDEDEDEDDIDEEEEDDEPEEKPTKKAGKDKTTSKKAPMNPPEDEDDDDWDDDDEDEEEEPAPKKKAESKKEKPAKKAESKKEKPAKKAEKKSKKDEDDDDDWDEDDWDE